MGWYTTLVVVLAALAAAVVLTPPPAMSAAQSSVGTQQTLGAVARVAYVAGFSAAFGTSVWVTFVAGVVLFRALPRHQFGTVQSHLFPAYFRFVAGAASLALASFSALHPLPSAAPGEKWQLATLTLPLAAALLNLLLLEPITTRVMRERHRIEKEAGIGGEVGLSKNKEVAKTNPQLRAINKTFGVYHGLSSLANLAGLVGLAAHLYYLASSINI